MRGDTKLERTVVRVVELLVQGKYEELESLSKTNRLTAQDLERAVADYGRSLTMPPMESLKQANVIEIGGSKPTKWYVGIDLWTVEEGRSDLTLELTLTDSLSDLYHIEVDDLHVL